MLLLGCKLPPKDQRTVQFLPLKKRKCGPLFIYNPADLFLRFPSTH